MAPVIKVNEERRFKPSVVLNKGVNNVEPQEQIITTATGPCWRETHPSPPLSTGEGAAAAEAPQRETENDEHCNAHQGEQRESMLVEHVFHASESEGASQAVMNPFRHELPLPNLRHNESLSTLVVSTKDDSLLSANASASAYQRRGALPRLGSGCDDQKIRRQRFASSSQQKPNTPSSDPTSPLLGKSSLSKIVVPKANLKLASFDGNERHEDSAACLEGSTMSTVVTDSDLRAAEMSYQRWINSFAIQ